MKDKYAFGIDIGGTAIKIGLFILDGTLIKKYEILTRKENLGEYILDDIADKIKGILIEESISFTKIKGIGVGVPGPVLGKGVVNRCVNLGWGETNIEERLSNLLEGMTIRAGNDANVAALGEMWKGGAKGHNNVVMITLGTGVGGGVIIDGKIVPGAFGAGGEIGHIKMSDTETEECGCGKKGCLEQYASATGISRFARTIMEEELSAKEIFNLAKEGNQKAEEIVDNMSNMLGTALSYISCVIDPEVYVIGGGVSNAGKFLIDKIKYFYQKNSFHASQDTMFALAELGNDAGIYGAVKMIL